MATSSSVVIRVKRTREEASLDDFVLREGPADSLVTKLNRLEVADDAAQAAVAAPTPVPARARRFRRVGTVTVEEADRLLADPAQLEQHVRDSVKEASALSVEGMAAKGRQQQEQSVRVSRLQILQERRLGAHRVLDVGLDARRVGSKREREAPAPEQQANDEIMCNGSALKRVDLSLAAPDDRVPRARPNDAAVVDLFVEEEFDGALPGQMLHELWLDPFDDDDGMGDAQRDDEDDDPDGAEVDYPSSSSSSPSSSGDDEFGDGWKTIRDSDQEPEYDVDGDPYDDDDNMRLDDRSMYLDDEANQHDQAPWNYWAK